MQKSIISQENPTNLSSPVPAPAPANLSAAEEKFSPNRNFALDSSIKSSVRSLLLPLVRECFQLVASNSFARFLQSNESSRASELINICQQIGKLQAEEFEAITRKLKKMQEEKGKNGSVKINRQNRKIRVLSKIDHRQRLQSRR